MPNYKILGEAETTLENLDKEFDSATPDIKKMYANNYVTERNKLLKKLGENFNIERHWVFGNDIEIKHNSEKGEEGGKLPVGFTLGDADARETLNKLIQPAGGISLPSSAEKPVSETHPS